MSAILTRRRPVVAALEGQVRLETGSLVRFGEPERVAVAVHWSATPLVSRSFRRLVREFDANGYRTVVVSACEVPQPLDWGGELPDGAVVLRKPNIGYDFGSWAIGLTWLPVASAPYVILANDSVLGPFTSLAPLLSRFEASEADVWSLTDNQQYFHHLQSYFLGFRGGVLDAGPLRRFFSTVRQERTKWQIIQRNELALSRLLQDNGYLTASMFRSESVVPSGFNPVIAGWRKLLDRGFPFVKREIVRDPSVAPDGEMVAREIHARFGERIEDWI